MKLSDVVLVDANDVGHRPAEIDAEHETIPVGVYGQSSRALVAPDGTITPIPDAPDAIVFRP